METFTRADVAANDSKSVGHIIDVTNENTCRGWRTRSFLGPVIDVASETFTRSDVAADESKFVGLIIDVTNE